MENNNRDQVDCFVRGLIKRNPGEHEFHQAVREVAETVMPYIDDHPEYRDAHILERMTEPDRIIVFRVTWEDDEGNVRVNRAWRVQFNNSIGPYKGGLRFHPTVTQSVLKFLGFEQTFKNSLTGLPMGGAHGASVKDVTDRSEMTYGGKNRLVGRFGPTGNLVRRRRGRRPRPSGRQTNRCPTAS